MPLEEKEPLMKMKEESEKAVLKLNLQKTRIMALEGMEIRRKKMEAVTDFILGVSKITVDSDSSHEIKDVCSLEGKLWQTQTTY